MLDSANETIASLKAELADVAADAEDARHAAEDAEAAAAQQAETDAQEKARLRSEIEAGEAALEAMSTSVNESGGKVAAAEVRVNWAKRTGVSSVLSC